jgi:enamine deaminase RidA (YjgF/YER057c/UK114 family)
MEIKSIFPLEMQKPKAHYSPATIYNGLIYVSGQLPLDANGEAMLGSIE